MLPILAWTHGLRQQHHHRGSGLVLDQPAGHQRLLCGALELSYEELRRLAVARTARVEPV